MICRYAPTMIVIFLPATGALGAQIVSVKARQAMEHKFGAEPPFTFLTLSSEDLESMQRSGPL